MTHRAHLPILLLIALIASVLAVPLAGQGDASAEDAATQDSAQDDDFYCDDGQPTPAPMRLEEARQGSLLWRTTHPGVYLPAPLLDTRVELAVQGLVARARVEQRFHNPTGDWLEGVYVFPLPETAAVDTLRMVVGERVIEGEIREREAARKEYEAAKREGKKASLVEQERPNLFTTSVANVGPDEDVVVVLEYQQDVRYDQGRFELRFPMVAGVRYIPGRARSEDPVGAFAGTGWAADTDRVPDASRITPPVADPRQGPINPVTLTVDLDAELGLERVESPSHRLKVDELGTGRYRIALAGAPVPADRDFVLEWAPPAGSEPRAALFTQVLGGDTYHLLMVVPPYGSEAGRYRLPRETIFVIDTSGSMNGTSIEQARAALLLALDRLQPEDAFNVIRFDSYAERLFPESRPATDPALSQARAWVAGLRADGGTEMSGALELAFGEQGEGGGGEVRQVIFITDGSVGNEAELLAYIAKHLGRSRLFTVGIGSAPNSYFMRKAAELGRGTHTHIGQVHEVAAKMGELFAKLEAPVVSDLEVFWDDPTAETWPEKPGDLYLGEPLLVAARLLGTPTEVRLRGWRGTTPWEETFRVDGGAAASGIDKLWARKKIGALMDLRAEGVAEEEVRARVVEVALAHHLVSSYTSLVAVDVTPTAPDGVVPKTRPLPVNLPAGWSYESTVGVLPRTATSAPMRLLAGILLLLIAARLARIGLRSS